MGARLPSDPQQPPLQYRVLGSLCVLVTRDGEACVTEPACLTGSERCPRGQLQTGGVLSPPSGEGPQHPPACLWVGRRPWYLREPVLVTAQELF